MGQDNMRRTQDVIDDAPAAADHSVDVEHAAGWSFLAAHSGYTLAEASEFADATTTDATPAPIHAAPPAPSRRLAAATAMASVAVATAVAVAGPAVADSTTPVGATIVKGAQVAAGAAPAIPAVIAGTLTVSGPTAPLAVGTQAVFRGGITKAPYRRAGYPVQLQVRRGTSWAVVMQGTSTTAGAYSFALPIKSAGQAYYRVYTPGADAVGPRASTAVPLMAGVGSPSAYALMKDRFRFDPCSTIGYRINFTGAPASARADVQGSISRIAMATGLRFSYQGSTTAVPFTNNSTYPAGTHLVFAFVTKGVSAALPATSRALAVGGPQTAWQSSVVNGRTWSKIANSGVLIDRNANLAPGFAQTNSWPYVTLGGVVLHELGHAVGLDHVFSDKLAMMATPPSPHSAELSLGDYAGLRQLGSSSGCFK